MMQEARSTVERLDRPSAYFNNKVCRPPFCPRFGSSPDSHDALSLIRNVAETTTAVARTTSPRDRRPSTTR